MSLLEYVPIYRAQLISSEIFLSLPILLLGLLYWYTRMTSAGIDCPATLIAGGAILLEMVASVWKSSFAKSVTWEMYIFLFFLSGFDLAQAYMMIRLVLPFEVVWKGWIPSGLVRSRWTKRERATRRLEGKVSWVQRGLVSTIECHLSELMGSSPLDCTQLYIQSIISISPSYIPSFKPITNTQIPNSQLSYCRS
jgi:hypothetical protein